MSDALSVCVSAVMLALPHSVWGPEEGWKNPAHRQESYAGHLVSKMPKSLRHEEEATAVKSWLNTWRNSVSMCLANDSYQFRGVTLFKTSSNLCGWWWWREQKRTSLTLWLGLGLQGSWSEKTSLWGKLCTTRYGKHSETKLGPHKAIFNKLLLREEQFF